MRWMKVARTHCGAAFCAAFLASALLIAGCGGAASRLAIHMERGHSYFDKGDFTHASIEFRNAMQIAPKNPSVLFMSGRTAEKLGKIREAAGLYQASIDASSDNVEARAALGRLLVLGGAPDRASTVIDPGLTKHPDDPSLLTVRGAIRLRTKNTSGALADIERALKLAPSNEDAIALRAGLYTQSGDTAGGIALVSESVQRLPKSIALREVLFNLYVSAQEPEKAEEQLQALIKLEPQELSYRKQLALFFARSHKLDDAQRTLEEAVRALPKNADAKLTLVNFITVQRTREQGEKTLRDFIAREPDDYDLRFGLGELLQRSGATTEALDAYNEVIRRDGTGPKGLVARDRIAAIYLAQGHDTEARDLLNQVLQKNPRDTDALLVRAELALKLNDTTTAIADLRGVLRDNPRSIPVQKLLARAYTQNGEPALAEQTLRGAMDIAPTDTSVRVQLANLLNETQRAEQAVPLLEEAVQRDPSDPRVREVLIGAYLDKHDYQAARKAAEDLKTLQPNLPIGPYLAGVAAQGAGQLDEAQKEFEHAHSMAPLGIEPLTALALLQLRRGHADQAIALAQKAVDTVGTKDAAPANLLGELYLATKDFPKAIATLTQATTIAPHWWPAFRNLSIAKVASQDTAGAIEAYKSGIKVAPAEPQLTIELARIYEGLQRVDDAIACYEALYTRNPHLQVAANNLAMLLVTYKTDRRSLDRARDLAASFASSTDGGLLDTNGWVHFKRGEYSEALPVLERAAQLSPEVKEIRYHVGMAELQVGQSERARANLEGALAGSAKYPWSDSARAVLAGIKDRSTG